MVRCARSSKGAKACGSSGECRTTKLRAGSRAPTSSARRAGSSRSVSRCSRRWRALEPSSRRASAVRPSSFRRAPASSSIQPTSKPSRTRCGPPLRYRGRTRPRAPRPPSTTSSIRLVGSRSFSSEPWQIGEPELDERAHLILEAGLARHVECLQERLPRLLGIDSLLQPIVPGYKKSLYLFARFFFTIFHNSLVTIAWGVVANPRSYCRRSFLVCRSAAGNSEHGPALRDGRDRHGRRPGGRARRVAQPGRRPHGHLDACPGRLRGDAEAEQEGPQDVRAHAHRVERTP